jgi:hypothetical protein
MRDSNHPGGAGRGQLPVPISEGRGGQLAPVQAVTPSTVLAELRQAEAPNSDEINLLDYWNIAIGRILHRVSEPASMPRPMPRVISKTGWHS